MLREFFNAILDAPAEAWLMVASKGVTATVVVIVFVASMIGLFNLAERIRMRRVPFLAGYLLAFFLVIEIIIGLVGFHFDVPTNSWLMTAFKGGAIAIAVIVFGAPLMWLMNQADKITERRGYTDKSAFWRLRLPFTAGYLVVSFSIIILTGGAIFYFDGK